MASFDRLPSRRVLATALGVVVGVALLAGGWWFVFGFGPGPGACACTPPPAFAFESTQSANGTAVVVTHDGGDPISHDRLRVVVNGEPRPWRGTASGTRDNESAVVVGDSVRLTGLESGDTVRVVWQPDDGGTPTEFGVYEVP